MEMMQPLLGGSTQVVQPSFGATPDAATVHQANNMAAVPTPAPAPVQSSYAPKSDVGKWLAEEIQAGRMTEDGRFLDGDFKGKLWYGDGAESYIKTLNSNKDKWTQGQREDLERRRIKEIRQELGLPEIQQTATATASPSVKMRNIPSNVQKEITDNMGLLETVMQAYNLTDKNPNATNFLKGILQNAGDTGHTLLNKLDPDGIQARAVLSNLSSKVIRDRSGAAVTAAEFPRLRPFLPQPTDNADEVKAKLKGFIDVMRDETGAYLQAQKDLGFAISPEIEKRLEKYKFPEKKTENRPDLGTFWIK